MLVSVARSCCFRIPPRPAPPRVCHHELDACSTDAGVGRRSVQPRTFFFSENPAAAAEEEAGTQRREAAEDAEEEAAAAAEQEAEGEKTT